MTRVRTFAALGLGAASLVLLPSATAQAATTCEGQPATIEASSGRITGTPGDDVIVARAKVVRVDAGEGDDVICVVKNIKSSAARTIDIDAGPGDDAVDTSRAGAGSSTILGAGADRFRGSSFREYVEVDEGDGRPDRVRTGGGRDRVWVAAGVVLSARLGAGHDELELFAHYTDTPLTGPGAVVRAQLGAGDDVLRFNTSYAGPGSEFLMGSGSDGVGFYDDWDVPGSGETSLIADLAEGLVTWHDMTSAVRDAENLSVTARTVDVRGNSSGTASSRWAAT
jgi:hypothetical protein